MSNIEVDESKLRSFRVVAGGPQPITKRVNAFVTNGYFFQTQKTEESKKTFRSYGGS